MVLLASFALAPATQAFSSTGQTVNTIGTGSETALSLAQALVGPGVTVTNSSYTGDDDSVGFVSGFAAGGLGINDGVALSSGRLDSHLAPDMTDQAPQVPNPSYEPALILNSAYDSGITSNSPFVINPNYDATNPLINPQCIEDASAFDTTAAFSNAPCIVNQNYEPQIVQNPSFDTLLAAPTNPEWITNPDYAPSSDTVYEPCISNPNFDPTGTFGEPNQYCTYNINYIWPMISDPDYVVRQIESSAILGPNLVESTSGIIGSPGDVDLDAIVSPSTTNDAAVLTIDFIPTQSTVSFQYVFGSDEYNEFANSSFNDVFAFWVNEDNRAVLNVNGVDLTDTNGNVIPVSINNVNSVNNPEFFRNNELNNNTPAIDVAFDGVTQVLTLTATVTANQVNRLKLAVADVQDSALDSTVVIRAGSFVSGNAAPSMSSGNFTTDFNTPYIGTFIGNDANGDALTYSVSSSPSHGTLTISGNSFTFVPTDGYSGADTFYITASDGQLTSDPAMFTVTVASAPVTVSPVVEQPTRTITIIGPPLQVDTRSPTPEPTPTPEPRLLATTDAVETMSEVAPSEPLSPETDLSIFASKLRMTGALGEEALRLGLTVALTLVLAILIALPTALLENSISGSHGRIAGFFRAILPAGAGANPTRLPLGAWLFTSVRGWGSAAIVILGSLVASFADPEFGFNMKSFQIFVTILASFLLINVLGTALIWLLTQRESRLTRPKIMARPIYLVIILLTVIFARSNDIEPALVFGSVLAIDYGVRVSKLGSVRVELLGAAYLVLIGMASWITYMAVTPPQGTELTVGQVWATELSAVLTVQSLSTLPIMLLPFAFLGGNRLWHWKKWVWALVYAAGLTIYSFVLIPFPFSWATTEKELWLWIAVFVAYSVLALAVWAWFLYLDKVQHVDRQKVKKI